MPYDGIFAPPVLTAPPPAGCRSLRLGWVLAHVAGRLEAVGSSQGLEREADAVAHVLLRQLGGALPVARLDRLQDLLVVVEEMQVVLTVAPRVSRRLEEEAAKQTHGEEERLVLRRGRDGEVKVEPGLRARLGVADRPPPALDRLLDALEIVVGGPLGG